MSFKDKMAGGFKNFGHMVAVGSKYFAEGVKFVVIGASKAQVIEPEVDALVAAVAGPQAAVLSDLAFHVLGDVAQALQPLSDDAAAAAAANGINLKIDAQVANDIRKAIKVIEALFKSQGAAVPPVA